ncbi:MAG: nucleotidyl transferase AbiEii/AbiGii toxin family protein, partial [Spirochaetia bacterium]
MKEYTAIQYVELFHLLFLDQLGRKLDKRFYVLKGGCNLRFYLRSFRYSDDADLDVAQTFPKEKLQDRVVSILDSIPFRQILQIHGIRIDRWTDPEQIETTQRWKVMLAVSRSDLRLPT